MNDELTNLRNSLAELDRSKNSLYIKSVGRSAYAAGDGWGPGIRSHYLLCYVVKGRATYFLDDKRFDLETGDSFLIPPHRLICIQAHPQYAWEYIKVGFAGDSVDGFIRRTGLYEEPVCRCGSGVDVQGYMEAMERSYGVKPWQRLAAVGHLCGLLSELVRRAWPEKEKLEANWDCARLAAEYIIDHYEEPITVEGLADYTAFIHSSLYRKFIKRYGISPKRFLVEFRVQKACCLLRYSNCSVQEIALSVGFEDPFYFSRAFKEIMGVSPRQYANEAKGKV